MRGTPSPITSLSTAGNNQRLDRIGRAVERNERPETRFDHQIGHLRGSVRNKRGGCRPSYNLIKFAPTPDSLRMFAFGIFVPLRCRPFHGSAIDARSPWGFAALHRRRYADTRLAGCDKRNLGSNFVMTASRLERIFSFGRADVKWLVVIRIFIRLRFSPICSLSGSSMSPKTSRATLFAARIHLR